MHGRIRRPMRAGRAIPLRRARRTPHRPRILTLRQEDSLFRRPAAPILNPPTAPAALAIMCRRAAARGRRIRRQVFHRSITHRRQRARGCNRRVGIAHHETLCFGGQCSPYRKAHNLRFLQPVVFDLSVKRPLADSEHFSRFFAVAGGQTERFVDEQPLDLRKRLADQCG